MVLTHYQVYRDKDKPLYKTGNKALIVVVIYNIIIFIGTKIFYVNVNA